MLSGSDDYAAQFADLWADTEAAGITATVSLPLIRDNGTSIGALGFAWAVAPPFNISLGNALRALAELCTEIVERAETYAAEHQLIGDLHLRLLTALPGVPGLQTAARYLPAGTWAAVGGDWYEGVVGHGLAAAADMALIRGMLTALLIDGVAVADVFDRVTKVLARRGEKVMASAALVVIDQALSTPTYATAGHPLLCSSLRQVP